MILIKNSWAMNPRLWWKQVIIMEVQNKRWYNNFFWRVTTMCLYFLYGGLVCQQYWKTFLMSIFLLDLPLSLWVGRLCPRNFLLVRLPNSSIIVTLQPFSINVHFYRESIFANISQTRFWDFVEWRRRKSLLSEDFEIKAKQKKRRYWRKWEDKNSFFAHFLQILYIYI